jgi:DNA-binding CsgD family transcriptional regulator
LRDSAAQAFARYNGHLAMVGGEDMIGYFDGPARAVRCGLALRDAAHAFGLELAAGVHTGEIEIRDQEFAGLTVHVAKDISTKARATEVLVSGVVADLVAGSGLNFAERGSQTLDGMPGELKLLAVTDAQHPDSITPTARPAGVETLSAREREVLVLVADGLSNAAIAKRLNLSDHTIKRHVANILLKLDLPTRAAAAALVGRTIPRGGL